MRFILGSLLLMLLVSSLSPVHGLLETVDINSRCQCMKTTSYLRSHHISRLTILKPGNGCPRTEIIVKMRSGIFKCLDPESRWTKKFVSRLQRLTKN